MMFKSFEDLFEVPLRNGLTKPKSVRGEGYKMVNMGELFAIPRMVNIPMDRVPLLPREIDTSLLKCGDLLFARQSLVREGAGQCSIFIFDEEDVCFESHLIRCRLDKDIANPLFYYYFFRSKLGKQAIDAITEQGAGAAGIRGSDLAKISVPYLDKAVQDVIAEQLNVIDDKIELNRQINQTLEQIAQTIFKSWFVDFDPVKAKIEAKAAGRDPERAAMCAISGTVHGCTNVAGARTAGATKSDAEFDQLFAEQRRQLAATAALFPGELVESELGLIPKGWEVSKVDSLVKRLKPRKRYTKKQVKPYGQIPVFEQGADILLGYHDESPGFIASSESPKFIFGDHTCVMHLSSQPFDISQNVIPLEGENHHTLWVYYAVCGKQEFQEYRRHWSELVVKDVISPCNELSKVFADFCTPLYVQKETLVKENRELGVLRDTLLPKLLSGEIIVNQAD